MKTNSNDQASNKADDEVTKIVQAALLQAHVSVNHPCPGTLFGFHEINGRLCKVECLVSDSQVVIVISKTENIRGPLGEVQARHAEANESPECMDGNQKWLRVTTTKARVYGRHEVIVCALRCGQSLDGSFFTGRIGKMLSFAQSTLK